MGRVFLWPDIQQGQLPAPESFLLLKRIVGERLRDEAGVEVAVCCGSVAYGTATTTSDFDCLALYKSHCHRQVIGVLSDLTATASLLCIPAKFIPVDVNLAQRGAHTIGHSFFEHLKLSAQLGGCIKGEILHSLFFGSQDYSREVHTYLVKKVDYFDKALVEAKTMGTFQFHVFLQKVLEIAVHVARKILWLERYKLPDDAKTTVIKNFPHVARSAHHVELFQRLVAAEKSYALELAMQMRNKDQARYQLALNAIEALAWDACNFVKLSISSMR